MAGAAIFKARRARGWSQTRLGRLLGVSAAAVSEWERGNNLTIERMLQVAPHLGIDVPGLLKVQELHEQIENSRLRHLVARGRTVPVMTMQQALRHFQNPGEPMQYQTQVNSHYDCSDGSFGIEINDAANSPKFKQGDYVLFDPEVPPQPEDMVAFYWEDGGVLVFRQLVATGSFPNIVYKLQALNDKWPSYDISRDEVEKIAGVMVVHMSFRQT